MAFFYYKDSRYCAPLFYNPEGRGFSSTDCIDTVDLSIDVGYYYIPKQQNNFFDSFLLEASGAKEVIVWVFLIMVARIRCASEAGFEILGKLKERLVKRRMLLVLFWYALVAPLGASVVHHQVHWRMPESVSQGEVFVQDLDLSSMPEADVKYRDLLSLTV